MRKRFWPILIACTLWRYAGAQAGTAAGQGGEAELPQLLSDVVVQSESIQLSDLLPGEVNPGLKSVAERIYLGRAPEPGSSRVLTLEDLRKKIQPKFRINIPEQIVIHRAGYPISPQRMREAVHALLGTKAPPDIGIYAPEVVTSRPDAELQARSTVRGQNAQTLMVRLQCRQRRDCAPFWAEVSFSEPVAIRSSGRSLTFRANTSLTLPATLVRPGHPAILICDQGGLRISMRVLPLKSAAIGESIKVLDPGTRRLFLAEVRGTNLVWSHLQETQ